MNKLTAFSAEVKMSSREIAELTGKRHPDVKRDIETMLEQLQEDVSKFARIYFDSMNRQQTEYLLDRRHTECLLTGYSAVLRMKVIDRWQELERERLAPKTQAEINLAYAMVQVEQEKRLIQLERKVEDIASGNLPAGFQGYTYLSDTSGITREKCRKLVNAYSVTTKTIPHVTPSGTVTKMTVVNEEEFMQAFNRMIATAVQRGQFHHSEALGRFMLSTKH